MFRRWRTRLRRGRAAAIDLVGRADGHDHDRWIAGEDRPLDDVPVSCVSLMTGAAAAAVSICTGCRRGDADIAAGIGGGRRDGVRPSQSFVDVIDQAPVPSANALPITAAPS